jgi:hypothetical protein
MVMFYYDLVNKFTTLDFENMRSNGCKTLHKWPWKWVILDLIGPISPCPLVGTRVINRVGSTGTSTCSLRSIRHRCLHLCQGITCAVFRKAVGMSATCLFRFLSSQFSWLGPTRTCTQYPPSMPALVPCSERQLVHVGEAFIPISEVTVFLTRTYKSVYP